MPLPLRVPTAIVAIDPASTLNLKPLKLQTGPNCLNYPEYHQLKFCLRYCSQNEGRNLQKDVCHNLKHNMGTMGPHIIMNSRKYPNRVTWHLIDVCRGPRITNLEDSINPDVEAIYRILSYPNMVYDMKCILWTPTMHTLASLPKEAASQPCSHQATIQTLAQMDHQLLLDMALISIISTATTLPYLVIIYNVYIYIYGSISK